MTDLLHDVRFAFRSLRQRPGFSLLAILTLALGIGASTAIYTVVQSVLLEPLDFPEPERLVVIQEKNPEAGFPRFSLSPLNYRDYRDMSQSFEAMAAATGTSLAWTPSDGGVAQRLNARAVTHEFLEVYGVGPVAGRDFGPEDDAYGAAPTIMISYQLWQKLGADRSVVDSDLMIDGEPTRVIGVLPEGVAPGRDALVPLGLDYEQTGRGGHWLVGYGRLKQDVSVEAARADLEHVAATLEAEYPDTNTGWGAIVDPLKERIVEGVETALWVLLGAVGVVLLIACANVANLTLTRLARHERDVAVRTALGAGRWRIVRQMLLESLVVAGLAGALGLALARWGVRVLVALDADNLPRSESIGMDASVLAFAFGVTLWTALLFGLVPALQAAKPDLAGTMKDGGRGHAGGRRGHRLRSSLVLAEVALALMLSIGAGLVVRSYGNLLEVDPGFDAASLWTASLSLPEASYPGDEQEIAFYDRLLEEMAALPGVESVATVRPMPLSGGDYVLAFYFEGRPIPKPNAEPNANIRFIRGDYFQTMGIPVHQGRALSDADRMDTLPVIAVNRSAADTYWPDEDPIGQRISFQSPDSEDVTWFTVVGIVGDVHHGSLDGTPEPAFYRSALQASSGSATLVLRTAGDPSALGAPLRALVGRLDANLPLFREQAGADYLAQSTAEPRFNATLLGAFAGLALLLAAVGVFGVISYTVAQQVREIGVRMALGAEAGRIVGWVVARGLRPVGWGIVLGLAGAFVASRLLTTLVYGVPTADPATYLAIAAGLAAVSVLACLFPAWRASRVEPVVVLRDE